MSASIIPAASNALMLNHLETAGFDKVYLDSRLINTQLMGDLDLDYLSMSEYLNYVQHMAAVTSMDVIADASVADSSWTLPAKISALQEVGCKAVIVDDVDLATPSELGHALNSIEAAINSDDLDVIVKLDGFVKYGLDELQARIDIAQLSGIDQIIISSISNRDLVIIKAVATTVLLSLIIDNANISNSGAQQLNPEYIFDTYHVYTGLVHAAKTVSQNMIIKLFMG